MPLSDSIVQRLQRFGTYGRLKQVALTSVRQGPGAEAWSLAQFGILLKLEGMMV